MKKLKEWYEGFFGDIDRSHMKAYAAEAAFFLVISLVPSILLLLTLVKYTPVTQDTIILAAIEVFPNSIDSMVVSIVEEVYNKSNSVIPITAVVALWSASRGVMSMASGLNWIYEVEEKKNYVYSRIKATIYTLLFMIAIVLSLVVLVFGNVIANFVMDYIPVIQHVIDFIIDIRVLVAMSVLTAVFMVAYKMLPNVQQKLKAQFPGALFAAVGWIGCSFAFSIYVDVYDGFSNMYGSLTTIILIMLWLYMCMYFMFIGARINVYIKERF